jgi:hypothetical protein
MSWGVSTMRLPFAIFANHRKLRVHEHARIHLRYDRAYPWRATARLFRISAPRRSEDAAEYVLPAPQEGSDSVILPNDDRANATATLGGIKWCVTTLSPVLNAHIVIAKGVIGWDETLPCGFR